MKVILFMAMSVNGMIARENDDEDFLAHENWVSFCKIAKKHGCFITGRRTYDVVRKKYKEYNFEDVRADKIIVSKKKSFRPKGYTVANSPKDALRKAKRLGLKSVVLVGGGKNNSSFMKSGLIDEIVLNIEPAVLGKGIRIFSEDNFYRRLKLVKTRKLAKDIVQLHYKVKK